MVKPTTTFCGACRGRDSGAGAGRVIGNLTPPGDAEGMAGQVVELLEDEDLRQRMGARAAQDARKRFDIERQAGEYLEWYEWISCNLKNVPCRTCSKTGLEEEIQLAFPFT